MNAYELCQRHVVTARRFEELSTAAWMMRERNVGCLVVVDPAGSQGGWRPVGMLSDRDIVTHVLARDCDPHSAVVEDAMMRNAPTVSNQTPIDDALQRMREAKVRRIPVVDERGRLTGILSVDDIFEHLLQRVPFGVTPIRPDLRFDQPGRTGIDRI